MMEEPKFYRLSTAEIRPLVIGRGICIASDRITIEGQPIRFMYRELPRDDHDSGWAFLSGTEEDDYLANPDNHSIFDVNAVANYDPSIIPHLDAAPGSAFTKMPGTKDFAQIQV